ncbi:MAG TPA: ActS/PrrB/RegB family redox-sensitive histidine kinase [Caulobacteraceae bacterium]|nr:ActS/PrrB/RegB family redox-sensitive histidine kinase [Caulobacteraceae bacterium]
MARTHLAEPPRPEADTALPPSAQADLVEVEGAGEGAQARSHFPDAGRLRTRTLIMLRWLAVAGQVSAVVVASALLGVRLAFLPLFAFIGAAAALNLGLAASPAATRVARAWEATAQLGFDILQLALLLAFTGGVVNPFALLLIAPVTVGAATLPARNAAGLGALAVGAAAALALGVHTMPWLGGTMLPLAFSYRAACGAAVSVGVAFTGGYAFRAASEAARMELALHVTETVLAREQRLTALGALAAAAAHELGTPLATIAVIAKELAREAPEGAMREDAELLLSQAQRCRDILRRLAETPDTGDALYERMSLLQFLREVMEPYHDRSQVRTEAVVTGPPGMAAPDVWRRPEVLHAMGSIVENAYDFARNEILITARFDVANIIVQVRDDGPGFSADVMAKLGEPYITSRPGAEGSRTGHVGMGLGFFIAKTLLERTGAEVDFRNGRRGGAVVTARWPRSRMEAVEGGAFGRGGA